MLEETGLVAQSTSDSFGFPFVQPGPRGVVVDDRNRAVGAPRLADRHRLELPLAFGGHSGQSSRVYRSSNDQSLYATFGVSVSSGVEALRRAATSLTG